MRYAFVILVLALSVAVLLRYDMQIASQHDHPPRGYVLDRWTGTVYSLHYQEMMRLPVVEPKDTR